MDILSFLAIIMLSGFLGALARQSITASTPPAPLEGEVTPPRAPGFAGFNLLAAVILGAAASLIVPLFLSIGNNTIIMSILTPNAPDIASKMLIVVGFCVLAGATAPSFIDTLAQKALVVAEANAQKVKQLAAEAQETKEIVAEERANRPASSGTAGVKTFSGALGKIDFGLESLGMPSASPSEHSVVDIIAGGPYRLRSIGGIAADLGIDRSQAATAVSGLVASGVLEAKRTSTGVTLYGLKTPPTE